MCTRLMAAKLASVFTKSNAAMKKVNLQSITDIRELSWALDRALFLLSNAPVNLRLSHLCRATGLPPSSLTRMKNLHVNPQYEPFVNQRILFNLLRYVLQQFPTLVLARDKNGNLEVRLYKNYGGYKLGPLEQDLPSDILFKRSLPKPGTTRWFLWQVNRENAPDAIRPT